MNRTGSARPTARLRGPRLFQSRPRPRLRDTRGSFAFFRPSRLAALQTSFVERRLFIRRLMPRGKTSRRQPTRHPPQDSVRLVFCIAQCRCRRQCWHSSPVRICGALRNCASSTGTSWRRRGRGFSHRSCPALSPGAGPDDCTMFESRTTMLHGTHSAQRPPLLLPQRPDVPGYAGRQRLHFQGTHRGRKLGWVA